MQSDLPLRSLLSVSLSECGIGTGERCQAASGDCGQGPGSGGCYLCACHNWELQEGSDPRNRELGIQAAIR